MPVSVLRENIYHIYLYTIFHFNTYCLLIINLFVYTDQNLEETLSTLKYGHGIFSLYMCQQKKNDKENSNDKKQ